MQDMELKDELRAVSGRKRRFILLRIIDVEPEAARQLCGITRGTYNTWLQNPAFVALHRRRAELAAEYKQEALRLMRRDNQLQAVLLEEKILQKMKEEVESGVYEIIRTNLAREVYSKLINDLDYQPQIKSLTWEQRIQNLNVGKDVPQIAEGEVIDAKVVIETAGESQAEHKEGKLLSEGEQTSDEAEEKAEES